MKNPSPMDKAVPRARLAANPSECSGPSWMRSQTEAAMKRMMPTAAVHKDRDPEKKPWFTAPEMKLMPEYFKSMQAWRAWNPERGV